MLYPHQIEYLRQHADLLRERLPKSLLAVSFVRQSKYDKIIPKMRGKMIPVSDEYAAQFPAGVPGIPNKLRPEDFEVIRGPA